VKFILNKFNVVVIPMANPDGVIYGNSRSSLTGYDLNRHWGADSIK
jgi:murein tripeptide amidase MpaA